MRGLILPPPALQSAVMINCKEILAALVAFDPPEATTLLYSDKVILRPRQLFLDLPELNPLKSVYNLVAAEKARSFCFLLKFK